MTGRAGAGPARAVAGSVIAGACLLAAGCGSTPAGSPGASAAAAPPPLQASYASAAGTSWAIVEMGGSAAQENNFWELFARPAGSSAWREATPLGVADNGGLVVAGAGTSLLTGFVPSQSLTFSPLAASTDNGANWSSSGLVDPGLAGLPDALAAGPGGRLIALTKGGKVELGQGLGTGWTSLSSARALAAAPAGRACGLAGLAAVAFSGSGVPMLAGDCGRPGVAGIFADSGGTWRAAGPVSPALPAALAREDIGVVRLATTGAGLVALLRAGTGADTSLVAAWSATGGSPWTVSAPLRIGTRQLRSTTVGPGWAVGVTLSDGRGATLTGPGATAWRTLPVLPKWAATLALGSSGQVDAIAAHGGTFTDWRLAGSGWNQAQTIKVTIPYGSSG